MKKENIKLSITILLVVVFSLSVTYAYMELSASNSTSENQSGCFVVNYSGQEINNSSLKSASDYTQGASSNIILSKNSGCKIYTEASIYIHTNSSETTAPLSNGAMKYKVMQGTTEIQSGTISAVDENSEDQLLATVALTNQNVTYTVYLWIDPEVSKGSYHGKNYSGYLYASSTQSSSIKE